MFYNTKEDVLMFHEDDACCKCKNIVAPIKCPLVNALISGVVGITTEDGGVFVGNCPMFKAQLQILKKSEGQDTGGVVEFKPKDE